jgi:hypothetical protein
MRRLLLLTVALALLAVPVAAGAGQSKPTCKRADSTTVVSNRFARVFEPNDAGPEGETVLLGCLRSVGKSVRLADAYDDEYVTKRAYSHVRLSGGFVAWAYLSSDLSCKADCPEGYDSISTSVAIRHLKRRKTRTIPTTELPRSLVLTAAGAVAWVEGYPKAYEVHVADSDGTRLADSGNIDPKSLSRAGATVSWTKDGVVQSTALR